MNDDAMDRALQDLIAEGLVEGEGETHGAHDSKKPQAAQLGSSEFERVVPAPTNPMGVARDLVADIYTPGDDLVLGHHRGDFYHFDGACWPETEARGIRGAIYKWLEGAVYFKDNQGLVPYEPTRRKVDDVVDALRAIVHVAGAKEPPAWLDGTTEPLANEVAAVGNGLLHIPSRKLLAHTPNFFSHHALPFDFDPRPRLRPAGSRSSSSYGATTGNRSTRCRRWWVTSSAGTRANRRSSS